MTAVVMLALLAAVPGPLEHVGGGPPVAWPDTPSQVGEMADDTFTITWTDFDAPIPTGTATIDLYYTDRMPPTFQLGIIPPDLHGEHIVGGIPEADLANRYVWNTSTVAAGAYFIWSLIDEPPSEGFTLRVVAFSRGVVTIAHPGDPVHPSVIVSRPGNPYDIAEGVFTLGYSAFDPDGTGRVKIEATTSTDATNFVLLAQDLPAVADGTFDWDTALYDEGDWMIRVTIEDDRGLSFVAFNRWFLRVEHPLVQPDAGTPMQGDSGSPSAPDSGIRVVNIDSGPRPTVQPADDGKCACNTTRPGAAWWGLLALAGLVVGRRRLR